MRQPVKPCGPIILLPLNTLSENTLAENTVLISTRFGKYTFDKYIFGKYTLVRPCLLVIPIKCLKSLKDRSSRLFSDCWCKNHHPLTDSQGKVLISKKYMVRIHHPTSQRCYLLQQLSSSLEVFVFILLFYQVVTCLLH